jgi:hypothetical protein
MARPNFGWLPGVLDLVLFLKNPVATNRGAVTIRIVERNIRNFPSRERERFVAVLPGLVAAMTGTQLLERFWRLELM